MHSLIIQMSYHFHSRISQHVVISNVPGEVGVVFGLKKPTVGKPRKPSPRSQSAHDKRVVSVKKVSLTWLSQTSGNLTRDVPHFLDSSKSQSRTLHESITSALRLQVTYFATAVGYRYLASRKSSQRSPFLLSTATQVTSSMVMEDSAMFVAKITWTQCNECSTKTKGPVGYTFT